MKIVITGSSGYIGSSLVERLLGIKNNIVIGIDRVNPQRQLKPEFSFIQLDLSSSNLILNPNIIKGADLVVHLAAARGDWNISNYEYWRDNFVATKKLLEAPWANSIPQWLFMSSVSVYGPSDFPMSEESSCSPFGSYGESKLASENIFKDFIHKNKLRGCVIRPSAVFSAGHPNNTNIYKLIESLRTRPLPLISGGQNFKTLTYLPNLIDLVVWSLNQMQTDKLTYATYNYVEEPVQRVVELISTLRDLGLAPARTVRVPLSIVLAASYPLYLLGLLSGTDPIITPERVRKFVANTRYDSSFVRKEGFIPKTHLTEALAKTVRWHLENIIHNN